jgi:subtilisin family serine protease
VTDNQEAVTSKLLTKLFEPDQVQVQPNTRIEDLSRARCGRIDSNWISSFRKINSLATEDTIGAVTTLTLPPCAFWEGPKVVAVPHDASLSHELMLHIGSQGKKTLSAVAKANQRSEYSLNNLKAGEKITLPYTSSFVSYTLRPEYRKNPEAAISELKASKTLIDALPEGQLALVKATSNADCAPLTDDSEYPFSAKDLVDILTLNSARRLSSGRALRIAVIGVVDSGIEEGESRLNFNLNPGEPKVPNEIDDDQNTYIDDIWGANLDHHEGLPTKYPGDDSGFHGTYVAGLVLGGLADDVLNALVKERLQVKILDVVSHEVIAASPPIDRYPIRTASLANAFQYATKYSGKIPILNLSVETSSDDAGLGLALQNSESLAIVAAGNDGKDLDQDEVYPAAMQEGLRTKLISVAASDRSGSLAPFSNWGKSTVDLAAPGCLIDSILPNNQRDRMSGTSAAAPLVSFTAGLLYSEGLTLAQVKNRILLTVTGDYTHLGVCLAGQHCVVAEGRLNVVHALDIYEDLLVYRNEDGRVLTSSGLVMDPCISLEDHCFAPSTQLAKLERLPTGWKAWIVSKGKQTHQEMFVDSSGNIRFEVSGTADPITIPMGRVLELIPAVWRSSR